MRVPEAGVPGEERQAVATWPNADGPGPGYPTSMNTTTRDIVASYPEYADAERAVDALSDRDFPVEALAIVGADLRSVEQITGRRGYGRAAGGGLVGGALIGWFVGLLLGLFSVVAPWTAALVLGLWGLVIGAVVGAVVGLIGHAMTGGRRDFSSMSTLEAERYEVLAEPNVAEQARRLIESLDQAGPDEVTSMDVGRSRR